MKQPISVGTVAYTTALLKKELGHLKGELAYWMHSRDEHIDHECNTELCDDMIHVHRMDVAQCETAIQELNSLVYEQPHNQTRSYSLHSGDTDQPTGIFERGQQLYTEDAAHDVAALDRALWDLQNNEWYCPIRSSFVLVRNSDYRVIARFDLDF